jgi:transposase
MEIRLISDHRKDLVAEQTRMINRLRWHLLDLWPEFEQTLKRRSFESQRLTERLDRRLRRMPRTDRGSCRSPAAGR